MDKDLEELCSIPVNMLLPNTIHQLFFTQKEYNANRGILDIIALNRSRIEKKLEDAKKAK